MDVIPGDPIAYLNVSEIVGRPGFGRTSLAASFAAIATRRGEVAAWIDSAGAFDPRSIAAAGADLSRILWVGADAAVRARDSAESPAAEFAPTRSNASAKAGIKPVLLAAEMVLGAGGFGLVVIDIGGHARTLTLSAALRLARAAERSGAAVIVLAERRTCGTFAALSLVLGRIRPFFSRTAPDAPALFDGMRVEAYVARNKLGGSGQAAVWRALVDLTPPRRHLPHQRLRDADWRARLGTSNSDRRARGGCIVSRSLTSAIDEATAKRRGLRIRQVMSVLAAWNAGVCLFLQ